MAKKNQPLPLELGSEQQQEEEQEVEEEVEELHPSIRSTPLIESYTYFSTDSITNLDISSTKKRKVSEVEELEGKGKGKGKAIEVVEDKLVEEKIGGGEFKTMEGQWMLGVDEAGRGPVLGPQVYGIAFCRIEFVDELKELGFADSKTLTAERRDNLLDVMIEQEKNVKWAVTVMSPFDLSRGMLRRNPYNLNAQSHDTTIALIKSTLDRGYEVTQCFVDTVGIASDYQKKLELLFPTITFVVTSKADSIYPIVSAASIAAKVTRDRVLENWTFMEPSWGETKDEGGREFGSGYPGDPKTIAWLEDNVEPIFGFPNVARFSWQTVKTILVKRAVKVKWNDEPATIQKYFSGGPKTTKIPLWNDFALASVGSF